MPFDFKKEYKEFYMPKNKPEIVTVPPANYIAVRGTGDPNEPDGAYQQAISVLYAIAYTLKMSYKTDHRIEGFFEYVVPPLEGFGGRRIRTASIMPINLLSTGSPSSACRISSRRMISPGPCRPPKRRKSLIAAKRSF